MLTDGGFLPTDEVETHNKTHRSRPPVRKRRRFSNFREETIPTLSPSLTPLPEKCHRTPCPPGPFPPRRKCFEIWRAIPGCFFCTWGCVTSCSSPIGRGPGRFFSGSGTTEGILSMREREDYSQDSKNYFTKKLMSLSFLSHINNSTCQYKLIIVVFYKPVIIRSCGLHQHI